MVEELIAFASFSMVSTSLTNSKLLKSLFTEFFFYRIKSNLCKAEYSLTSGVWGYSLATFANYWYLLLANSSKAYAERWAFSVRLNLVISLSTLHMKKILFLSLITSPKTFSVLEGTFMLVIFETLTSKRLLGRKSLFFWFSRRFGVVTLLTSFS